ncbi:hypothetical protein [Pseudomonas sp.]|uniref:hypothetical protein n=1 Tax=Pseudomonas sp. TaxID=306 RepID=UPI0029148C99|nr:hypothetical protein [Pseudomonas sp.]MDU4254470.1 hypothetical protein [Pseudomonas sp.]
MKALALSVAAGIAVLGAPPASATGIPVFCYNCQEASHNAAHSILDGIRSQTEALLNGMDYVMRTQAELETAREVALAQTNQKIANSYAMDPTLGAKPRAACGQFAAASLRGASSAGGSALRASLAKNTMAYNQRNRNLAPKEPRLDYAVQQVFSELDDPSDPVVGGEVLLEDKPIDATNVEELKKQKNLTNLLLNPFPIEEPTQEAVERIKANGSPAEKENLARSIVMQQRMSTGQYVFDQKTQRNLQTLETAKLKYLISDIEKYLTDEQKKALAGEKISPQQLNELMATYRVRSPAWTAEVVSTPSPENSRRDQSLMMAEILNQLWDLNETSRLMLQLAAAKETREVSQSGMQSR